MLSNLIKINLVEVPELNNNNNIRIIEDIQQPILNLKKDEIIMVDTGENYFE